MPKIDPHTGCTVMTMAEFWAAEAKREGKGRCGWELAEDMYADMERETREHEARLKADPSSLLKDLRDYYVPDGSWDWPDGEDPGWTPEEILSAESVELSDGFKESSMNASLVVRCSDGKVRRLKVATRSFSGSWDEPPDHDVNVEDCGEVDHGS
jgi:hypothetical protein